MEIRRTALVEGGPARGRLRAVVRGAVPDEGDDLLDDGPTKRRAWGVDALDAAVQAGAPAWVASWWVATARGGNVGDAFMAWTATAAWLRGWRRGQWAAGLGPRAFMGAARRPRPAGGRVRLRRPAAMRVHWRIGLRHRWFDCDPHKPDPEDLALPCPGLPDACTWLPSSSWRAARIVGVRDDGVELHRWKLPRAPGSDPEDRDEDEWWAEQLSRREVCGMMIAILGRMARPPLAVVMPCGRRACPKCARRMQARAVWRYVPLFAAPLRGGFGLEMFTIGSVSPDPSRPDDVGTVIDDAEYNTWRRHLGSFLDTMDRGSSECGIGSGTWRGGLAVVETVPRRIGAYVHAHIVAVRRDFYPYGWSRSKWLERAFAVGGDAEVRRLEGLGRWTPRQLAGLLTDDEVLTWSGRNVADVVPRDRRLAAAAACLGVREVLRRSGLGEVCQSSGVITAGAGGIAEYVSKVAAYVAKVEKESGGDLPYGRIEDRPDLMRMLRGKRRIQPFGDVRGLFAGPDLVERDERRWLVEIAFADPELDLNARTHKVGRRLVVDEPIVPRDQLEWHDDVPRERTAWIDLRSLETWREWADVDALLRVLQPQAPQAPQVPAPQEAEPQEEARDVPEPAPVEVPDEVRIDPGWSDQLLIGGGIEHVPYEAVAVARRSRRKRRKPGRGPP